MRSEIDKAGGDIPGSERNTKKSKRVPSGPPGKENGYREGFRVMKAFELGLKYNHEKK